VTKSPDPAQAELDRAVRVRLFREAADTGQVPQPPRIAESLNLPLPEVQASIRRLAAGKVLILAPNDGDIWAANPFCAVPSGFRVEAIGRSYWGICIWDSLGIAAALDADAQITAPCGDCGEPMRLEVRGGRLTHAEGIVHFAVPARRWWENIGFT
jgi:Alkylmercury lyase